MPSRLPRVVLASPLSPSGRSFRWRPSWFLVGRVIFDGSRDGFRSRRERRDLIWTQSLAASAWRRARSTGGRAASPVPGGEQSRSARAAVAPAGGGCCRQAVGAPAAPRGPRIHHWVEVNILSPTPPSPDEGLVSCRERCLSRLCLPWSPRTLHGYGALIPGWTGGKVLAPHSAFPETPGGARNCRWWPAVERACPRHSCPTRWPLSEPPLQGAACSRGIVSAHWDFTLPAPSPPPRSVLCPLGARVSG